VTRERRIPSDLGAAFRAEGGRSGLAALEAAQATERDGSGVLGGIAVEALHNEGGRLVRVTRRLRST